MTAEYNSAEKRAELLADGTGWQRMKTVELTPVPTGANQMLVVFRCWHTYRSSGNWSGTTTYSPSSYVGLSFTGTHIDTTDSTNAEYDNLFGFAALDASSPFTSVYLTLSTRFSAVGTSINVGAYALSGHGIIDSALASSNVDYPFEPANGETYGNEYIHCWRIYTDLVDDTVNYECWISDENINLETFDFTTINPDNPKDQLGQYSTSTRSGTIHGDVTGTNWRPTTGVMAFPTHFLAKWGDDGVGMGLYIKDLSVHYHRLTT